MELAPYNSVHPRYCYDIDVVSYRVTFVNTGHIVQILNRKQSIKPKNLTHNKQIHS